MAGKCAAFLSFCYVWINSYFVFPLPFTHTHKNILTFSLFGFEFGILWLCVESFVESWNLLKLVVFLPLHVDERKTSVQVIWRKKTRKLNSNTRCMLLEHFTIISKHLKVACKSIARENENRQKNRNTTTPHACHSFIFIWSIERVSHSYKSRWHLTKWHSHRLFRFGV